MGLLEAMGDIDVKTFYWVLISLFLYIIFPLSVFNVSRYIPF